MRSRQTPAPRSLGWPYRPVRTTTQAWPKDRMMANSFCAVW
jgi:hypothetical protein